MKILQKIPLAFYILLCYICLSGFYAFERILNTDNSYYFFNLVNTQFFWFAENRMGIFLSQAPLLLGVRLGVPLNVLIYVYSISFPALFLLIAAFCHYYLKVKEAALALALILITGVAYSFFHPVTETYHALAFAVLLYALLVSERFKQQPLLYFLFTFFAALLSILSHPIGVFVVGFVALFSLVSKQIKIAPFLFVLLICGASTLLRLIFVSPTSYDVQQYDALFARFSAHNDWSQAYPIIFLKSRLNNAYQSTVILIIVYAALSFYSKKMHLFIISLICATGLAIIGILTFFKGDADMMMEKTFLPSIFMLLLPFCYLFFTNTHFSRTSLHIIIGIMSILSFRHIYNASKVATERLTVLQSIASESTHPKLIATLADFNDPALHFNHWNTPVDSYIISKCKQHKAFTLFLTYDKYSFEFDSTDQTIFLGPPWAPYWKKKLVNQNYFELPLTGYRLYENNAKN